MGMANINMEDDGEGGTFVNFVYVGEFDPASPAHQNILIAQKVLELLLPQLGPVKLIPISKHEFSFHQLAQQTRVKIEMEGLTDPMAGIDTMLKGQA